MSMYGYVSLRDSSSSRSASQRTFTLTPCALGSTLMWPRYDVRPLPLLMERDTMLLVVLGATWIALLPASWCCPVPANAALITSACAPSPMRYTLGYFMVILELCATMPFAMKLL